MASQNLMLLIDGREQKIIVEQSTAVKELFDFISINIMNIQSSDKNWTCFSHTTNRFMNRDDRIENQQNDTLIIKTNPQSIKVDRKQEESAQIPLSIIVTNGNNTVEFQRDYDEQTSLQEIAQSILVNCQLSQQENPPFVSLQIQNQTYNDVIKRSKSLAQLQIKNYTIIEARIT